MIRLYFNRRDDLAGCWSVDHGPGTLEYRTNEVEIFAITGITRKDFTQHGPNTVSAWIEYKNAKMVINPIEDTITIKSNGHDTKKD